MKRYVLERLLRSVVSILLVTTIAYTMIFTMVPRDLVFEGDTLINKLKSKPDELLAYKHEKWEMLGYLDFAAPNELCAMATEGTDDFNKCFEEGTDINNSYITSWNAKSKKWVVGTMPISGMQYATREIGVFERVVNFYKKFVVVDHPWKISDPSNPDLKRGLGLSFGKEQGLAAITCSGCENKSLMYIDGSFPFIHQNIVSLNLGVSYPQYERVPVMDVISKTQGSPVLKPLTFETGVKANSAANLKKCTYKTTESLDKFDVQRFNDNYANCVPNLNAPSMLSTSLITGTIAVFIAYSIGVPAGVYLARKKGLLPDTIGVGVVTILISVPSLAFIYFFRFLGGKLGFPILFPLLGPGDIRSYVLPTLTLGLLSISGLVIWIRRYMIDQQSADYVKFAKAKGLNDKEIASRHIFRNAIIPITNGIPRSIVGAIQGATITETVFAMSGMGKMLPDAIKGHNNGMVIGLLFIFTTMSIIAVFAGDILLTKVDPRISLSNKGGSN